MADLISKYVDVTYDGTNQQVIEGVYQYDHGLSLRVYGVPTNVTYQVQFGIRGGDTSVTMVPTISDGAVVCVIPDTLLMQDREIACYLYYEDSNYGITVFEFSIPPTPRIQPATGTYTPEQISAYDALVAELQDLIELMPDNAKRVADLNAATDGGFYTFTNSASHRPTDIFVSGGALLVMKYSDDYLTQLATPNTFDNYKVALRKYKQGSFGPWMETTFTTQPNVTVSGTTPSITGVSGVSYECGEVSTLSIQAPATGDIEVMFTSGSTPTTLTVTSARSGVTSIVWANDFDASNLDANTVYDIFITKGQYGVAAAWAI